MEKLIFIRDRGREGIKNQPKIEKRRAKDEIFFCLSCTICLSLVQNVGNFYNFTRETSAFRI
jgi:hypothetical protein